MKTVLIGVDWGTSNLRVLRIGEGGALLGLRADPRGAGGLAPADFPDVLAQTAGDWLDEATPVLVCGMAGAKARWIEVPYRPCPAGLHDLAAGLVAPDPGRDIRIAPGVCMTDDGGLRDVMRGEETQIMGLLAEGEADATVVLPGTHSKWARVRNGRIAGFRTFMTGDLFAALRQATLLGQDMGDPGGDDAAFRTGVARGLSDPALTAALFSVRVEMLAGRLGPESTGDYLSGLLIGAEIAAQGLTSPQGPETPPIRLVGTRQLTARYVMALAVAGITAVEAADGADITARGLWRIWETSRA